MKKVLAGLFSIILVIGIVMVGCSSSTPTTSTAPSPTKTTAATTTSSATATVTPTAPGTSATVKPIELSFATILPPVHPDYTQALQPWADEVAKRTNGRVKITFFNGGTLGTITEQYDLVAKNAAQLSLIALTQYPGRFPLADVFNLPFFIPTDAIGGQKSIDIRHMVYQKYLTPLYLKGLHLVATGRYSPGQLQMSKTTVIKTLDDMKGLTIGFPGGAIASSFIQALGASPSLMSVSDMYTSLDRGVINGQLQAWQVQQSFKLSEVTHSVTVIDNYQASDSIIMNQGVWDSLPPDIQKVFNDLGPYLEDLRYKVGVSADQAGIAAATKAGSQIIYLSPAEKQRWVDAAKPLEQKWVTQMNGQGLNATAMYNDIQSMLSASTTPTP